MLLGSHPVIAFTSALLTPFSLDIGTRSFNSDESLGLNPMSPSSVRRFERTVGNSLVSHDAPFAILVLMAGRRTR